MYKYKSRLSYCLKCRKNIENINPKISGTSTGKTIISDCVICARKKSRFTNKARSKCVIEQFKTPLSSIPLIGPLLF